MPQLVCVVSRLGTAEIPGFHLMLFIGSTCSRCEACTETVVLPDSRRVIPEQSFTLSNDFIMSPVSLLFFSVLPYFICRKDQLFI